METTCKRCNESLRDADRYCPVCGLPQLMYVAAELPVRVLGDDAEEDGVSDEPGARRGGLFGGRPGQSGQAGRSGRGGGNVGLAEELPGGIAWRSALRAALLMGIPAGILCSQLTPVGSSPLSLFWMMSAAAWAVSLYVRQSRMGRLSMGSGVRIGLVTGLFATWLALSLDGADMWVQRFVLHRGAHMDALWLAQVEEGLQLNQQLFSQMGLASAQMTQILQANRALMMSPEGHAGMQLWELVLGSASLTFFAIVGGAVGARFLVHRGRPSAQR